jgi:tetratricopeptide (TPR) repeat protein
MNLKIGLVLMIASHWVCWGADVSQEFQKGLLEEEANHNLSAAVAAYERVVAQMGEQRKIGAAALFRLGEAYRKMGKTNEARVNYEKLIQEYPEQERYTSAAKGIIGNGTRARIGTNLSDSSEVDRAFFDFETLRAQLSVLKQKSKSELGQIILTVIPDPQLRDLQREIKRTESELNQARYRYGPKHPNIIEKERALKGLRSQAESRLEAVVSGLDTTLEVRRNVVVTLGVLGVQRRGRAQLQTHLEREMFQMAELTGKLAALKGKEPKNNAKLVQQVAPDVILNELILSLDRFEAEIDQLKLRLRAKHPEMILAVQTLQVANDQAGDRAMEVVKGLEASVLIKSNLVAALEREVGERGREN